MFGKYHLLRSSRVHSFCLCLSQTPSIMPGLSFLMKKRFHPGHIDNQERVWVKENNFMIKKEKDIELQVERLKEKEILRYEEMMAKNGGEVDARETSLQFMYALPKQKQGDDTNTVSINPSEQLM